LNKEREREKERDPFLYFSQSLFFLLSFSISCSSFYFSSSGINNRHVGHFRHSISTNTEDMVRLNLYCLEWAIARTLKNIIRVTITSTTTTNKQTNKQYDFLSLLLLLSDKHAINDGFGSYSCRGTVL
jgi:hypothetical protein